MSDFDIDTDDEELDECIECSGSGHCQECDGQGYNAVVCNYGHDHDEDCDECYGSGDCPECDGAGEL